MSADPNLQSLSKASDIAVSLVRDFSKNLTFLLAAGVTSLALLAWAPISDWRIQTILAAIPVFVFTYCIGLLWTSYRGVRQQRHFLRCLGEDEKRVLRLFLEQDRRTMHMNVFYAPTASLIAKGILSHATSTFPAFDAAVVIQSYSYEYLASRPRLIGLKKEEVGKKEIDDSDCSWLSKP